MLESILRYPRQPKADLIKEFFPQAFSEYREPLVEGGTVFLYIRQRYPQVRCWINDLNPELTTFWTEARDNNTELIRKIKDTKRKVEGLKLYKLLKNSKPKSTTEKAAKLYILNKITVDGSNRYSPEAFTRELTEDSINQIEQLEELLQGVKITCLDYRELLKENDLEIFTYLDPPAWNTKKLNGLNTTFKHNRFIDEIKKYKSKWLVTYENNFIIKRLLKEYQIDDNNYLNEQMIIRNYEA
jgi:DNA adenine methylase